MNNIQINSVLHQLREVARTIEVTPGAAETSTVDFGSVLKTSLNQVNEVQQQAGELATRFEMEDPQVSLPTVMVALEKASVSFEALRQVRNRIVSAYQEIMNMPI